MSMSAWFERFDVQCSQLLPQLSVLRDEPMRAHTTFRIGGNARRMARVRSGEELSALLTLVYEEGYPYLLLGNGSNLLVSDAGVDVLVIHTGEMQQIERVDENTLYAQAGVPLAKLAVFAMKHSLTGLEFAHGIPGTLGGAVCMNAGAYGGEMSQVVREVTAWLPGKGACRMSLDELALSYRHSYFTDHEGVVLGATLCLKNGNEADIRTQMEELIGRRRDKQPLEYPSAGSTFKRPEGHFAGALIEQCGLKGMTVGGAQVSEKHAGFVINTGNATSADVLALIGEIQKIVHERTGVMLEPEIKMVG
ncbi:MAG: UDP-N-acetylmuramate dehydrogenase [Oscillospiraceae bacterium]|nr:UDP-N-acetylmuramate dehydrogenase [Oscillospiraceae bacterium]